MFIDVGAPKYLAPTERNRLNMGLAPMERGQRFRCWLQTFGSYGAKILQVCVDASGVNNKLQIYRSRVTVAIGQHLL